MSLRISKIRKAHGYTQAALAMKVGVSTNYLAQIERGEKPAGHRILGKIAEEFGVRVVDLADDGLPQSTQDAVLQVTALAQDGVVPENVTNLLTVLKKLSPKEIDLVLDYARLQAGVH